MDPQMLGLGWVCSLIGLFCPWAMRNKRHHGSCKRSRPPSLRGVVGRSRSRSRSLGAFDCLADQTLERDVNLDDVDSDWVGDIQKLAVRKGYLPGPEMLRGVSRLAEAGADPHAGALGPSGREPHQAQLFEEDLRDFTLLWRGLGGDGSRHGLLRNQQFRIFAGQFGHSDSSQAPVHKLRFERTGRNQIRKGRTQEDPRGRPHFLPLTWKALTSNRRRR